MAKHPIFKVVLMSAFVVATGFTFYAISKTINDFAVSVSSHQTADVILASATPGQDTVVSTPVSYFSQKADPCVNIYDKFMAEELKHRQFEWSECGYSGNGFEQGLVAATLDEKFLPVAVGGTIITNRGISADSFGRWFHEVEGVSVSYPKVLDLQYAEQDHSYYYNSENFYPLDGTKLFTMNLNLPFYASLSGDEKLEIVADDDTWVFVGDKMVLDMGGVHGEMAGYFRIDENGMIYAAVNSGEEKAMNVEIAKAQGSIIRIFHANRDSLESVFDLKISNIALHVDNAAIAYDAEFVKPLGESNKVMPNHDQAMLSSIIVQFCILGALLMLTPVMVRMLLKKRA